MGEATGDGSNTPRTKGKALRPIIARSSDDIRRQSVFEKGNTVAQRQSAFLESLQLQLIIGGHRDQGLDGRVEVAMLLTQSFDFAGEFRPFFVVQFFVHLKPLAMVLWRLRAFARIMSAPRAESKVKKSASTRKEQSHEKAVAVGALPKARDIKPCHRIEYYVVFNRIVEDPWRI
jgi:hypothetical protein